MLYRKRKPRRIRCFFLLPRESIPRFGYGGRGGGGHGRVLAQGSGSSRGACPPVRNPCKPLRNLCKGCFRKGTFDLQTRATWLGRLHCKQPWHHLAISHRPGREKSLLSGSNPGRHRPQSQQRPNSLPPLRSSCRPRPERRWWRTRLRG